MDHGPDPGVLLAHSFELARGPRVRLRLAQLRDLKAISELVRAQRGAEHQADEDPSALVKSDPRTHVAICATALIGLRETILGFGAIEVGERSPTLLVVDRAQTGGLEDLLTQALLSRSTAIAARLAA